MLGGSHGHGRGRGRGHWYSFGCSVCLINDEAVRCMSYLINVPLEDSHVCHNVIPTWPTHLHVEAINLMYPRNSHFRML